MGRCLSRWGSQIVLYASLPTAGASSDANYQLALAAELFPIEHWGPFTSANELSLLATDASTATYYTFVVTTVPSVEMAGEPEAVPGDGTAACWSLVGQGSQRVGCSPGGEMPEWWDMNAWPIAFQKLGFTGTARPRIHADDPVDVERDQRSADFRRVVRHVAMADHVRRQANRRDQHGEHDAVWAG